MKSFKLVLIVLFLLILIFSLSADETLFNESFGPSGPTKIWTYDETNGSSTRVSRKDGKDSHGFSLRGFNTSDKIINGDFTSGLNTGWWFDSHSNIELSSESKIGSNAVLVRGYANTNLVINGSFIGGLFSWEPIGDPGDVIIIYDSSEGGNVVEVTGGSTWETQVKSSIFEVQGGDYKYRLESFVKKISGSGRYKVTIEWLDSNEQHLAYDNDWKGLDNPSTYTYHGDTFNSPSNAEHAKIIIGVDPGTKVRFSKIALKKCIHWENSSEILSDWMNVVLGDTVTISAYVKYLATSALDKYKVTIEWEGGVRQYDNDWLGTYQSTNYVEHSGEFIVPEGATRARIILGVRDGVIAVFDDISFTTRSNDVETSMKSPIFPGVQPGQLYRLSSYVKQISGTGKYSVAIAWFDGDGTHIKDWKDLDKFIGDEFTGEYGTSIYANDWNGTDRPANFIEHGGHTLFGVTESEIKNDLQGYLPPENARKAQIIVSVEPGVEIVIDEISLITTSTNMNDELFLANEYIMVGVTKKRGGAIHFLSDKKVDLTRSYINDHDSGRLIQRSFFGNERNDSGVIDPEWDFMDWNPVQGGNQSYKDGDTRKPVQYKGFLPDGNGIIKRVGDEIHTYCIPLNWNYYSRTRSIMKTIISLDDRTVKTRTLFYNKCFKNRAKNRDQELLAVYVTQDLKWFRMYHGTMPFSPSLDPLIPLDFIPLDKVNHAGEPTVHNIFKNNVAPTEKWAAWVNGDGYGVGMYSKDVKLYSDTYHFDAFRYSETGLQDVDGDVKSDDDDNNYMGIIPTFDVANHADNKVEFTSDIILGDIDYIRAYAYFQEGKGLKPTPYTSSGSVTLTSPNGGETLTSSTTHNITWSSSVDVQYVKLEYSTDNGATYTDITAGVDNTGTYEWTVPSVNSSSCLVRITESNGVAQDQNEADTPPSDTSDAVFTVVNNVTPTITISSPSGGDDWNMGSQYTITWDKTGVQHENVKITLYDPTGTNLIYTMTINTENDGSYNWTIPDNVFSVGNYLVRVKTTDNLIYDDSDTMTISPTNTMKAEIISPSPGSHLSGGTVTFIWSTDNGATGYELWVGSSPASSDIVTSGGWQTGSSQTLSGLPTDGSAVYVRIWTQINGEHLNNYNDYVYTSHLLVGSTKSYTLYAINVNNALSWDNPYRAAFAPDGLRAIQPYTGEAVAGVKLYVNGFDSWTLPAGEVITNVKIGAYISFSKTAQYGNIYIDTNISGVSTGKRLVPGTEHWEEYDATHAYANWTKANIDALIVKVTRAKLHVPSSHFQVDSIRLVVTTEAPSITVTYPLVGAIWQIGSTQDIIWNKSGTQDANVKLRLYQNDVKIMDITDSTPNDGSYSWTILNTVAPASNYVVRVKTTDNLIYDDSDTMTISPTNTMKAAIISPSPGSTLSGSTETFTWNTIAGASDYYIRLGTTQGGDEITDSGTWQTGSSQTFSILPTDSSIVYIRIYTRISGVWETNYNDYTYTASVGVVQKAEIISPSPGSLLSGGTVTFTWSTDSGATGYELWVGSSPASSDIVTSGGWQTGSSQTLSGLPTDGSAVYVRIWTQINGEHLNNYNDYVYTSHLLVGSTKSYTLYAINVNNALSWDNPYRAAFAPDGLRAIQPYTGEAVAGVKLYVNGFDSWTLPAGEVITNVKIGAYISFSKTAQYGNIYIDTNISGVSTGKRLVPGTEHWEEYDATHAYANWTKANIDALIVKVTRAKLHVPSSHFQVDSIRLVVTTEAPSITVTYPLVGAIWQIGSTQDIIWNKSGTQDANVKLRLYQNDVKIMDITDSTPNDGSYSWTILNTVAPASNYVVRVSTVDNLLTDDSEGSFEITDTQSALRLTSPNGNEEFLSGNSIPIIWEIGDKILNIKIEYSTDNGSTYQIITNNTMNNGVYNWNVPHDISSDCLIRLSDADKKSDHNLEISYSFRFKFDKDQNPGTTFVLWLGEYKNDSLKNSIMTNMFIPKLSFIHENDGMIYVELNENRKIIGKVNNRRELWDKLRVQSNLQNNTLSLWVNNNIIFDNIDLPEEYRFDGTISLTGNISIDDLIVKIKSSRKDREVGLESQTSFNPLLVMDFENGKQNGIRFTSEKKSYNLDLNKKGYEIRDELNSPKQNKILKLKEGVTMIKLFDISNGFPFDVSDKVFKIIYKENLESKNVK